MICGVPLLDKSSCMTLEIIAAILAKCGGGYTCLQIFLVSKHDHHWRGKKHIQLCRQLVSNIACNPIWTPQITAPQSLIWGGVI